MEIYFLSILNLSAHSLIKPAFGILYGPISILFFLFTALGLVFIYKAVGCMGISYGKAGPFKGKQKNIPQRYSGKHGLRSARSGTQDTPTASLPTDKSANMGQTAASESCYPETDAEFPEDESIFVFCCDQELEDLLSKPQEEFDKLLPKAAISLEFLPLVTEGEQAPDVMAVHPEANAMNEIENSGDEPQISNSQLQDTWLGLLQHIVEPETIGSESEHAKKGEGREEGLNPGRQKEVVRKHDLDLPEFCIFEELFRNCDNESKLILIDEIYAVGDEKELRFLQKLAVDPDPKVRARAAHIRADLEKALIAEAEVVDSLSPLHPMDVRHWPDGNRIQKKNEDVPDSEDATITEGAINSAESLQPLEVCFLAISGQTHPVADALDIEFEVDSHTLQEQGEPRSRIKVREHKTESGQNGHGIFENLAKITYRFHF